MAQLLTNLLRSRVAGGVLLSGTAFLTVQARSTVRSTSASASSSSSSFLPPLTLYQYRTCPFCSKTRAFLDYHGIQYKLVEVNPVFRREIKFTSQRKLPFIISGDTQINDSSLIISVLKTCLLTGTSLGASLASYPEMTSTDDKGRTYTERMNKYFIMYGESATAETLDQLREERQWREWVDCKLVRCLSPNIYRTPGEALEAMALTTSVANLNRIERVFAKYLGSIGMYFIGRSMKKKYKLDNDVRQSLYRYGDEWMKAVGAHRKFMGGDKPNLADLAVYGVLSAIEGLRAFEDLTAHTKIKPWYNAVKEKVEKQEGATVT